MILMSSLDRQSFVGLRAIRKVSDVVSNAKLRKSEHFYFSSLVIDLSHLCSRFIVPETMTLCCHIQACHLVCPFYCSYNLMAMTKCFRERTMLGANAMHSNHLLLIQSHGNDTVFQGAYDAWCKHNAFKYI